jgi:hypothetical protein
MIPVKKYSENLPGFLSEDAIDNLHHLLPTLTEAWEKRQVYRTSVEMRYVVLNDASFPTKASKYWQAVREQTLMLENMMIEGFSYRRNEIKIRKLKDLISTEEDVFKSDEYKVDLDECLFKQAQLRQVGEDRMREIIEWESIKEELDDGSFNTINVEQDQLRTLILQLNNRLDSLPINASQSEILNIRGPLETLVSKLKSQQGDATNASKIS